MQFATIFVPWPITFIQSVQLPNHLRWRMKEVAHIEPVRFLLTCWSIASLYSYTCLSPNKASGVTPSRSDKIQPFPIFVYALNGKCIVIHVDSFDIVVSFVKSAIESETGIPASKQILMFGRHQLHDHLSLAEYNVQKESNLHLSVPLSGGMPNNSEQNSLFTEAFGNHGDPLPGAGAQSAMEVTQTQEVAANVMTEVKAEAVDADGLSVEELGAANKIENAIDNDELLDQETESVMRS